MKIVLPETHFVKSLLFSLWPALPLDLSESESDMVLDFLSWEPGRRCCSWNWTRMKLREGDDIGRDVKS